MLGAAIGAGEERILAIERHRPFILPMSGKSERFTIPGIPISAEKSVCDV